MAIIYNVGIVLIPFQSKVKHLYALPILFMLAYIWYTSQTSEPGQGAGCYYCFALMGSQILGWHAMSAV